MSATDKLVEKNCKLAELQFLASQGAVNIGLRGHAATPGNPLGSNGGSRARSDLIVTRKSRFGQKVWSYVVGRKPAASRSGFPYRQMSAGRR